MSYYQQNNPRRQKLVRDKPPIVPPGGTSLESFDLEGPKRPDIDTLAELNERLQEALIVEQYTIPPYLCALYSIHEGTNEEAVSIIRTVVVEEMLHMVMVANLMNALGFKPEIKGKSLIQAYPSHLPKSSVDFKVGLLKFSKESINTFLRIEKPAAEGAKPVEGKFPSIGVFYEAIRESLRWHEAIAKEKGESIFKPNLDKQVTAEDYYGAGGILLTVSNLDDAEAVLDEIVGQGEGIDGSINVAISEGEELAHYFRFNQIFYERKYKQGDTAQHPPSGDPLPVDWNSVYNMEPNPRMDKYKTDYPWIYEKMKAFNKTYGKLLDSIHEGCNREPKDKSDPEVDPKELNWLRKVSVPLMFQLRTQAVELMKIPNGNGNYTAGPSFEYVE